MSMLQSYPEFRSRDLKEIEAAIAISAQSDRAEMPAGRRCGVFVANAARFDDAALTFRKYDNCITLGFRPTDYMRLVYQIGEVGEVSLEGKVMESAASEAGYLIPDDARWQVRYPRGFRNLAFRIGAKTLQRKLSVVLDNERAALDLRQPAAADPRRAELLRQSVFYFARELEAADPRFLPAVAANAIETISLRLLHCASGSVLERTRRPPPAPSAAQLGRVEAYLVANFAEPLSLEKLTQVSGVSFGSVFAHFLSRYRCTPNGYLQHIRLDMARMTLSYSQDPGAVVSIAVRCGFHSLRQFECAYRNKFGVKPLDGLRLAG